MNDRLGSDGSTWDSGGGGTDGGPQPIGVRSTNPPGRDFTALTVAQQGKPLPILYGTQKVPVFLAEKATPSLNVPPAWSTTTSGQPFSIGDYVTRNGNAYRCTQSGSNTWYWQGSRTYTVGQKVVNTTPGLALPGGSTTPSYDSRYVCVIGGTSAATGGPTGTSGSNIIDGTAQWTYDGPAGPTGTDTYNEAPLTGAGAIWQYVQKLPFTAWFQHPLGVICEGEAKGATTRFWWDKELITVEDATHPGHGMQIGLGPDAGGQTVPSTFDASGYQHTVVIYPRNEPTSGIQSGTQSELSAMAVEMQGVMFGATTPDVNPADIVNDILTHTRRGAGWPGSRVGASITGTGAADYRVYCDAAGLRLSAYFDTQRTALSMLADILTATNTDAVFSGGVLRLVPRGDQPITAPVYGTTNYAPANTSQYSIGVDDYLDLDNPVTITPRTSDTDSFNSMPVEFIDRSAVYGKLTVEDPDMTDVEIRGAVLRGPTTALPFSFPDGSAPVMLSRIYAQRSLNVRNEYRFRLPWRYVLLEPTDIITISDPATGLSNVPVRIIRVQEVEAGAAGGLEITAEDYPAAVFAARSYTPQASTGYTPNEKGTRAGGIPTAVTGTSLTIEPKAMPNAALTHRNFDNLWPNPTSEDAPPSGDPATSPEWAQRYNAGAGAYAGNWVRRLFTAQHTPILAGDLNPAPVADQSQLGVYVRCSPGESFYIESYLKVPTATSPDTAGVYVLFFDASSAVVSASITDTRQTGVVASWTKVTAYGTAPANAVKAFLFCFANCANGATDAQFDAIYARRQVDSMPLIVSAKYGGAGQWTFTDYWYRLLNGIAGGAPTGDANWPNGSGNGVIWWRGNNDPTLNGGAPVIWDATYGDRLTLNGYQSLGWQNNTAAGAGLEIGPYFSLVRIKYTIQPKSNSDNLDSLTTLILQCYDNAGVIRGDPFYAPLAIGRGYKVPGTPSDAGNALVGVVLVPVSTSIVMFYNSSPFAPNGYMRATLRNIYGDSAQRDYSFLSNVDGVTATSGATIPGASTPAGSSGGGGGTTDGGGCPAPYHLITLESGAAVRADQLQNGDRVQGCDQALQPAVGTVYNVGRIMAERWRVVLTDGRELIFSRDHRIATANRGWMLVQDLPAGEPLLAQTPATVQSVALFDTGPVITFTVRDTGTYFCEGILQHNLKPR